MSLSEGHLREINRLRRIAEMDVQSGVQSTSLAEDNTDDLRRLLTRLRSSRSWRLTAPIRKIGRFLKNPWVIFSDDCPIGAFDDAQSLQAEIARLEASASWRITAPLRFLNKLPLRR